MFWTLPMEGRRQGWLTAKFHADFREFLLHAAHRYGLWCPAYCLMPDHLHLHWMGVGLDSDQLNAMRWLRRQIHLVLPGFRLQHQAHDHVLRAEERGTNALHNHCVNYVLHNPKRGGLVERAEDWQFSGMMVPGFTRLNPFETDSWDIYWRYYAVECGGETAPKVTEA